MAEEQSARKIRNGLLALGVLVGLWYFIGKGDRAFQRAAAALRGVKSYRVDITESGKKSMRSISVSCPDRFRIVPPPDARGSAAEFIVIGKDRYGRVDQGRWIRVPESFVSLPALNLCSGPSADGDPKDLAAILEHLAFNGRVESTGEQELSGFTCHGWQARRRGPLVDPSEAPQLTICIDETNGLPVQLTVQGAEWTFSGWNEPMKIEAPAVPVTTTTP
jgi:hypothetical protein